MATRTLRPVAPGERPSRRTTKTKGVIEAAANGTTRELLIAMRDRIAKDVESDKTPARDLAALTRRLLEIARELEAMDVRAQEEGDTHAPSADVKWSAV